MGTNQNDRGMSDQSVLVLYSGGDAPGMNMHLRCMVRIGLNRYQTRVIGCRDGYLGLMRTCRRVSNGKLSLEELRDELESFPGQCGLSRRNQDLVRLDHASVQGLTGQGGIVLGAARCLEFHDFQNRKQVIDLMDSLGVSTVVVVGGDGSTAGASRLAQESNLRVFAVPATIDNDLPAMTEIAMGFDTAISNSVWCMEHCNDTAASHHRIIVVQTMGRNSGQLAKAAGLAAGAEIVVTPERGYMDQTKMERIARRIERSFIKSHDHAIVVVAEGVQTCAAAPQSPAVVLATHLEHHFATLPDSSGEENRRPHVDVRACILGHLQRGGRPTSADRILAARFARAAWRCIEAESQSGILGVRAGRIRLHPFSDAEAVDVHQAKAKNDAEPELDLYETLKDISACSEIVAS